MSSRRIIEAFDDWRRDGRPLALATVYDTIGSTYSKAGHRILISADGNYSGLISGGCLEGDLAEHAARVLAGRSARPVTYDLRDEVEDVFGLGVGCNGLIRVFIQPLFAEDDYRPFAALRDCYDHPRRLITATVIESTEGGVTTGSTFLTSENAGWTALSETDESREFLSVLKTVALPSPDRMSAARYEQLNGHAVLFALLRPIPRVLILGAGLDAVPLVRMTAELGWYVDVADHRPAYLERDELSVADSVQLVDPRNLTESVDALERYDAAIVMSHHLETDTAYLRSLAQLELNYLGVLGPPARREKLLDTLAADFPDLNRRLRGPIGLDIGGGGPEAIALSILAELQSVFSIRT